LLELINSSGHSDPSYIVNTKQACQEVITGYDSGAGANLAGRVASVTAKQCDGNITSYSEVYSYETWGALNWRDSKWTRSGSTLVRRVDPNYNTMGIVSDFGYGTTGSLYSYTYAYDNAWRPVSMTGESLTLVSGVSYNAAGAITAFSRNDGSGTAVNNSYTFNCMRMTNPRASMALCVLRPLRLSSVWV